MKRDRTAVGVFLAVAGLVGAYQFGRARADGVPTVTPLFYGGLLEDNGQPVEGRRDLVVRLWDAASGGSAVCTTPAAGVEFVGGRFRVPLDGACTGAVRANPNLWAEVRIGGTTFARSKLGAVPYALEAGRASGAAGALETRLAALEGRPSPRFFLRGPLPPRDAENQLIPIPVTCPPIPMGSDYVITDFGRPETDFEFTIPENGNYHVTAMGVFARIPQGGATPRCSLVSLPTDTTIPNGLGMIIALNAGRYAVRCVFFASTTVCSNAPTFELSTPAIVSGW